MLSNHMSIHEDESENGYLFNQILEDQTLKKLVTERLLVPCQSYVFWKLVPYTFTIYLLLTIILIMNVILILMSYLRFKRCL